MKDHDVRVTKISSNIQKCISLAFMLFALALSFPSYAEDQSTSNRGESRYLKELNKNDYREVEAPKTVPVFRWDFSKKKIQAYSYEQEVINKTVISAEAGNEMGDPEQRINNRWGRTKITKCNNI